MGKERRRKAGIRTNSETLRPTLRSAFSISLAINIKMLYAFPEVSSLFFDTSVKTGRYRNRGENKGRKQNGFELVKLRYRHLFDFFIHRCIRYLPRN